MALGLVQGWERLPALGDTCLAQPWLVVTGTAMVSSHWHNREPQG